MANPPGQSVYRLRPEDPRAVYFTPERYRITADGRTDVSDALQSAIREVKTHYNFGIVFIPEGKYLITKTIYVPTAVRLIGYGKTRPVFILGRNSPGFQKANSTDKGRAHYMFWFVNNLSEPGSPVYDAGASTFYSAISNSNIKIEDGNPAAVALRTHFAQHSYISHVDIDAGHGKAGLYDVGNEMEDVRFFGGDYGIYTTKPSPGWPYMMVDVGFEGQRLAAIRTHEAGLTIVRLQAKNVPIVIDIDSNYHEKLFMEDCRFDGIGKVAIHITDDGNAFNQVNLRNIACRNTPVLTIGRLSRLTAPGNIYMVKSLTDGLQIDSWQADPVYKTTEDIEPLSVFPGPAPSDIPPLPDMEQWTNIRTLGAKGDGATDDTKIIQDAIDHHAVLYFPQGWYRITTPLHLKANTVLIGLSPIATQLLITDNTPAFGGFGGPQPMVETPRGGNNIITGIGLSTGASNPRAVACKWQSGAGSYLNDVKFVGGHGGLTPGPGFLPTPSADEPLPGTKPATRAGAVQGDRGEKNWDTQYWSLWITNDGGGTFKNIWTANTFASAGVYVSHTNTPSHVYALSVEHHVRNEIRFNAVAHWKVYALQLEEESRESTECQPMELEDCHNMVFANLYMFRVIRVDKPYPWSIRRWGGDDLEFLNVHNYSQTPYTTTVPLYDVDANSEIRPWEFARLYIGSEKSATPPPATAEITRLFTGAEFAQSPCSDSKGNIYFCESRKRRIYRWSPATNKTTLIADYPWQPLSLSCDKNDNLLVVFKYVPKPGTGETFSNPIDAAGTSFSGWGNSGFAVWAYAINPENPDETIRLLPTIPMGSINPKTALYPSHRWRDYHDFNTVSVARPQNCFVAPDSTTIIPIVYDLARSTALTKAIPGHPLYTTDEYDKRTVRLQVDDQGYLSHLTYFAERGEFATATDEKGNVYIADGEVYAYNPAGQLITTIKTPERPTGITVGTEPAEAEQGNTKTLFITSHQSLFKTTTIILPLRSPNRS